MIRVIKTWNAELESKKKIYIFSFRFSSLYHLKNTFCKWLLPLSTLTRSHFFFLGISKQDFFLIITEISLYIFWHDYFLNTAVPWQNKLFSRVFRHNNPYKAFKHLSNRDGIKGAEFLFHKEIIQYKYNFTQ